MLRHSIKLIKFHTVKISDYEAFGEHVERNFIELKLPTSKTL